MQEGRVWSLLRELDLACHNWDLCSQILKITTTTTKMSLKKNSLITVHLPPFLLYFFIAAINSTKELTGNWGVSGRRKKTMTSGHFLTKSLWYLVFQFVGTESSTSVFLITTCSVHLCSPLLPTVWFAWETAQLSQRKNMYDLILASK